MIDSIHYETDGTRVFTVRYVPAGNSSNREWFTSVQGARLALVRLNRDIGQWLFERLPLNTFSWGTMRHAVRRYRILRSAMWSIFHGQGTWAHYDGRYSDATRTIGRTLWVARSLRGWAACR